MLLGFELEQTKVRLTQLSELLDNVPADSARFLFLDGSEHRYLLCCLRLIEIASEHRMAGTEAVPRMIYRNLLCFQTTSL